MRSRSRLRRSLPAIALLTVLLTPSGARAAGSSTLASGEPGSGPAIPTTAAPAATNGIRWSDVPKSYWARGAIDYVGATNDWMRDYHALDDGTYPFNSDKLESRERFARSIVRAFAPSQPTDPTIEFPDLPQSDRFYRFANVAVELGWMDVDAKGNFLPRDPVSTRMVHQALVLALGLGNVALHLQHLQMEDGTPLEVPPGFGTLLLGMRLGLRYNHSDESLDVGPDTSLPRSQVAWSLYRAATASSWTIDSLSDYGTMVLPVLSNDVRRVVEFGLRYVGYPYVWGGEWDEPSPPGYCCGTQPVGGFDCSGFSWWVLHAVMDGWDPVPPRDYPGWSLPQRTSAAMAAAEHAITYHKLQPGDLMFYDGDGDGTVDHVDVYIGNGWSMDSGGSAAGVSIVRVDPGTWYRDHFVHGGRVIR